eukprot:241410-Pelagomonas_calceolata.AAC.2
MSPLMLLQVYIKWRNLHCFFLVDQSLKPASLPIVPYLVFKLRISNGSTIPKLHPGEARHAHLQLQRASLVRIFPSYILNRWTLSRSHPGGPLHPHRPAPVAARCGERPAHRQLAHPPVLCQAAGQAAVQGGAEMCCCSRCGCDVLLCVICCCSRWGCDVLLLHISFTTYCILPDEALKQLHVLPIICGTVLRSFLLHAMDQPNGIQTGCHSKFFSVSWLNAFRNGTTQPAAFSSQISG